MSFISKLFGYADKLSNLEEDLSGSLNNVSGNNNSKLQPQQSIDNTPAAQQAAPAGGNPLPWGDTMPSEENQFSFNGSYYEYFDKVFKEAFPSFEITYAPVPNRHTGSMAFTFAQGGAKRLVVDVMSERCSSKAFERECRKNGIPYLRFYYDHHGWWNTKSYVVNRVSGVLR